MIRYSLCSQKNSNIVVIIIKIFTRFFKKKNKFNCYESTTSIYRKGKNFKNR